FVMKKEHAEMWPYMQRLQAACEQQTALAELHEPALALFRLLQVHNPKEEEVVYTAADRLAAENPGAPWLAALHAETVPAGWRGAMRSAVDMQFRRPGRHRRRASQASAAVWPAATAAAGRVSSASTKVAASVGSALPMAGAHCASK